MHKYTRSVYECCLTTTCRTHTCATYFSARFESMTHKRITASCIQPNVFITSNLSLTKHSLRWRSMEDALSTYTEHMLILPAACSNLHACFSPSQSCQISPLCAWKRMVSQSDAHATVQFTSSYIAVWSLEQGAHDVFFHSIKILEANSSRAKSIQM